jgi:hypothetical protein
MWEYNMRAVRVYQERLALTLRKQILWEPETATDAEVRAMTAKADPGDGGEQPPILGTTSGRADINVLNSLTRARIVATAHEHALTTSAVTVGPRTPGARLVATRRYLNALTRIHSVSELRLGGGTQIAMP